MTLDELNIQYCRNTPSSNQKDAIYEESNNGGINNTSPVQSYIFNNMQNNERLSSCAEIASEDDDRNNAYRMFNNMFQRPPTTQCFKNEMQYDDMQTYVTSSFRQTLIPEKPMENQPEIAATNIKLEKYSQMVTNNGTEAVQEMIPLDHHNRDSSESISTKEEICVVDSDRGTDKTEEEIVPKEKEYGSTKKSGSGMRKLEKPPYSYIALIVMAIQSSPTMKLTLNEIYEYLQSKFSFFRGEYKKVGKTLSGTIYLLMIVSSSFQKVSVALAKGHYWTVDPASVTVFQDGSSKRRPRGFKRRCHIPDMQRYSMYYAGGIPSPPMMGFDMMSQGNVPCGPLQQTALANLLQPYQAESNDLLGKRNPRLTVRRKCGMSFHPCYYQNSSPSGSVIGYEGLNQHNPGVPPVTMGAISTNMAGLQPYFSSSEQMMMTGIPSNPQHYGYSMSNNNSALNINPSGMVTSSHYMSSCAVAGATTSPLNSPATGSDFGGVATTAPPSLAYGANASDQNPVVASWPVLNGVSSAADAYIKQSPSKSNK
ncbi:forkhead box protein F1-B [Caerostris extrusa]|uniref:Forkhead box protein F1-B n=1 Tax=Caerostris extrusa TaxID=172846 RepID=A0AAV4RD42_CAEEX|nr:forkhead box protein F1-B [Caerostris extrusa]